MRNLDGNRIESIDVKKRILEAFYALTPNINQMQQHVDILSEIPVGHILLSIDKAIMSAQIDEINFSTFMNKVCRSLETEFINTRIVNVLDNNKLRDELGKRIIRSTKKSLSIQKEKGFRLSNEQNYIRSLKFILQYVQKGSMKVSPELKACLDGIDLMSLVKEAQTKVKVILPRLTKAIQSVCEDELGLWETKLTLSTDKDGKMRRRTLMVFYVDSETLIDRFRTTPMEYVEVCSELGYSSHGAVREGIERVLNQQYSLDLEICEIVEKLLGSEKVYGHYLDKQPISDKGKPTLIDIGRKQTLARIEEYRRRNLEWFYSEWSVDARGRIYMVMPGCSSTEDKLSKSMLRSPIPRKLGENGLTWLYRSLAGAFGLDKMSWNERCDFGKVNHQRFLKLGRDAMMGDHEEVMMELLKEADNPWDALMLCIELYRIQLQYDLGVPSEEVTSTLLSGLDCTCSAVQLISCMVGGYVAAEGSNVLTRTFNERPNDFYQIVGTSMNEFVDGIDVKKEANRLANTEYIKRDVKVRKRPAMTQSRVSGLLQIYSDIPENKKRKHIWKPCIMPKFYGNTSNGRKDKLHNELTNYLTSVGINLDFHEMLDLVTMINHVFETVMRTDERLKPLEAYLEYMRAIATAYARVGKSPIWSTDGKNRISPKALTEEKASRMSYYDGNGLVKTCTLFESTPMHLAPEFMELYTNKLRLDGNKTKTKLSPDFIHSFDARLLFEIAIKLGDAPVAFTHDCFRTTLGDMSSLQEVAMQAFQDLFSDGKGGRALVRLQYSCLRDTGIKIEIPTAIKLSGIKSKDMIGNAYCIC
jgi:hypothetical protein